jgi:hypothetical protein
MMDTGAEASRGCTVIRRRERFLGIERAGGGKSFTFLLNCLNAKSATGLVR